MDYRRELDERVRRERSAVWGVAEEPPPPAPQSLRHSHPLRNRCAVKRETARLAKYLYDVRQDLDRIIELES